MNDSAYIIAVKKIHAPSDAVERALSYAKSADPKPLFDTEEKRPLIRSVRLIAAASVVLVVALSVSSYFLFGNINHSQLPILSSAQSASSVTEPTDGTKLPTDHLMPVIPSATQAETSPQPSTDSKIQDSEPREELPSAFQESTAAPSKPKDEPRPTGEPELSSETQVAPTTPLTTPTYPGMPFVPPPVEPSEEPSAGECYAYIPLEQLTGEGRVYCMLYNRYGSLMGDDDLFSAAHLATREWERDGMIWVSYRPSADYFCPSDVYGIYFYNEDGFILSYQETHI